MESFIRRLGQLVDLDDAAKRFLWSLPVEARAVERRRALFDETKKATGLYFVERGWAARYALRANGARRIVGLLLPGDFCGIHAASGAAFDHLTVALTPCSIGVVALDDLQRAKVAVPALDQALWRAKLVDEATLRKSLLISADATQAMAHLLCELSVRAALAGEGSEAAFSLPLTQEELGDTLGISAVHTNRVIRKLCDLGIIERSKDELTFLDPRQLQRIGQFTRNYLAPWRLS